MIPYGRQSISEDDIAAVEAVLRSDFLTQGPAVPAFEQAVAGYCGVPHAVAVCNATAALHLACAALGLGPGDRVWTSPNTFVASANCARYCGADVDFVDIDPRTYNLSVTALEAKLAQAEKAGALPKIVIPVHFAGQSCEMKQIWALSKRYGFAVIEDASHAIGADYDGAKVGNGRYSHATVFSFHPVKIITTGEGGMVLTRDSALHEKLSRLRSHGITRDPSRMQGEPEGPWYYQQIELGWNFRLTDIQAALGASQMQRLDAFVDKRRARVRRYNEQLKNLAAVLPAQSPAGDPSWHLYVVQVENRRKVFDALRTAGIGVNVHYIPVHLQPYYRALGFKPGDFPEAERYYSRAISLPLYADLSDSQQDTVVAALARAL